MPRYKVITIREWYEFGKVEVEAEDPTAARGKVRAMLTDGDERIEWDRDRMAPGKHWIESHREVT